MKKILSFIIIALMFVSCEKRKALVNDNSTIGSISCKPAIDREVAKMNFRARPARTDPPPLVVWRYHETNSLYGKSLDVTLCPIYATEHHPARQVDMFLKEDSCQVVNIAKNPVIDCVYQ